MANDYLQFSEVLTHLTEQEAGWLRQQLEIIYVFDGDEYTENDLPIDLESAVGGWVGCRAFRDMEGYDPGYGEDVGFGFQFNDDDEQWGRHLWIYAVECGNADHAAHLVQKFLREFRPTECWRLTYAVTCSTPRVGHFGGGAVFVTADEVQWQSAYDFVDQQQEAFHQKSGEAAGLVSSSHDLNELLAYAESNRLQPDDLDDLVHDAVSHYASDVNQGGLAGQIRFLVEQLGAAEARQMLKTLAGPESAPN